MTEVERFCRRSAVKLALAALATLLPGPACAAAAEYPNRPIQLIVPYAPGGATDTVARLVAQGLAERLGQPVPIVNRPGAGTIVGSQTVAHAPPDGYTIGMIAVPHAANYALYKEMPYAQSDFAPITPVMLTSNVLVVTPSLPVKTVAEFIDYIKARPGAINYAAYGVGSSAHLAALLFEARIGTRLVPVHYRGGAPAAMAVMTGEVQMLFGTPFSVAGGIASGKLRPVAVTSAQRLNILPDIPTMREAGLDYVNHAWFGLVAPAGTPAPIVGQLNEAVRAVMAQPEVRRTLLDAGNEVFVTTPEEFARFIEEETTLWSRLLGGLATEKQ